MTLQEAQEKSIAPWSNLTTDLGPVKVFADAYPVTVGHRLFVPATDTEDDIQSCFEQAYRYGKIMVRNKACDGFNVGMNVGASAGQTVMYPHIHCIPRRAGDCEDPVGGVRGVVPGQANYKKDTYKDPT